MIYLKDNPYARVRKATGETRAGFKPLAHQDVIEAVKAALYETYDVVNDERYSTTPEGRDAVWCGIPQQDGQQPPLPWIGLRHGTSGRASSRIYGGLCVPKEWSVTFECHQFKSGTGATKAILRSIEDAVTLWLLHLDSYAQRLSRLRTTKITPEEMDSLTLKLAEAKVVPYKKLAKLQKGRKDGPERSIDFIKRLCQLMHEIPPVTAVPAADHMGRIMRTCEEILR